MSNAQVLVAHGTRRASGRAMIGDLAAAVQQSLRSPVHVAFVDVVDPRPTEVLAQVGPAVVVPAFLASGYHVRQDLPRQVAASGNPAVAVARSLGPDPALARLLFTRLHEVGWQPGDQVVMAAAGSTDAVACGQVQRAATLLSGMVGQRVPVGYLASAAPKIEEVVGAVTAGGRRTFIATYLLADGLFAQRLTQLPVHAVAAPLMCDPQGRPDPRLVSLVASRFRSVRPPV